MRTCTTIFTPPNQTFYDLIFGPTIIAIKRGKLLGCLEQNINSNHMLQLDTPSIIGDLILLNPEVLVNPYMYFTHTQNINSINDFSFLSTYDKSLHAVVMSTCYRMLQIISLSLQHRIALSRLNKNAKFIYTGIVSILPIYVMAFLGFNSIELGMMSLLVSVSPYILSNNWSNRIREIDLVSTTKEFVFKNALLNNCLSSIRNVTSTLLVGVGFGLLFSFFSYYFKDPRFSVVVDEAYVIRHDIQICRLSSNSNQLYGLSVLTHTHWLTQMFFLQASWCLGRLAIDLGIGLLNKLNIIPDARDLFYNQTFRKSSVSLQALAPKESIQPNKKRPVAPVSYSEYTPANPKIRKAKGKKFEPAQQPDDEALPGVATAVNRDLPIIQVPDYPFQPLVPFYPAPQSVPTYGVVANTKCRQFDLFSRLLQNAANSVANADGAIECLDTATQVYAIRRPKLDTRLLGQKATGQSAVVNVLKRLYGYERAWLVEEMDIPSVVPFAKETNHARYSDAVASFGRAT